MDFYQKLINNKKSIIYIISIMIFLFTFLFIYLFYLNYDNQNQLFSISENLNFNSFENIQNYLKIKPQKDYCYEDDIFVKCEKVTYNSLLKSGKYKLEIYNINNKISYLILENKHSFFNFIFILFLYILTIFLTIFFLYYLKILYKIIKERIQYSPLIYDLNNLEEKLKKDNEKLNTEKKNLEKIRSEEEREIRKQRHEILEKTLILENREKLISIKEEQIEFTNLNINFEITNKEYQEKILLKMESILNKYNEIKINGKIYDLSEEGYLKLKDSYENQISFLHRKIARNKLYKEKDFNGKYFKDLEVHHIKTDQKLNVFINNLFVCTKEEHQLIHRKLLNKFNEEEVVREIIKNRK
ncbi:MAG: hypothetical protein PHT94_05280 [Candidatus Nanoarchaeia archaeon]|nr:hypothetical protein [Candidatus Nanoarchaeia archaeon]